MTNTQVVKGSLLTDYLKLDAVSSILVEGITYWIEPSRIELVEMHLGDKDTSVLLEGTFLSIRYCDGQHDHDLYVPISRVMALRTFVPDDAEE